MKVADLSAELSDPTPEQSDYEVVVWDGEQGEEFPLGDAKWEHEEKKLVLSF